MNARAATPILSIRAWPAHILNGLSVAIGIGGIRLVVGALAGPLAAQLALSGALGVGVADQPSTPARTASRALLAACLAFAAACLVALLRPWPVALGLACAGLAFVAAMLFAWGQRAAPISFAPILSLVFAMAVPPDSSSLRAMATWNGIGAAAYVCWAVATSWLLQRRYRALALANALDSTSALLRARAQLLQDAGFDLHDTMAMQSWVRGEFELAEHLQQARDFVFGATPGPECRRNSAILLRAFDLRDLLLASRLDLDLLGNDAAGRWILGRVAIGLRRVGEVIESAALALRTRTLPPVLHAEEFAMRELFAHAPLEANDPRLRLLPALAERLKNLANDALRIHAQLHGDVDARILSERALRRFVAPDRWPLADLLRNLSWQSPVLRHATRSALAIGSAYFLALRLPWSSHPHWVILTVAVILRGNLEQTLSRRNMRVFGTLVGCVLVVVLARVHSPALLAVIFVLAVGTAHAFALRRYWVAATAATLMALLQAHLINPDAGFPIVERIADTLLGALLAWAFSYVLPSWERKRMVQTVNRLLDELKVYADYALVVDAAKDDIEQRLARRRAYESLSDLATLMQRSIVEPRAVRVPVPQLAILLDHAQRLMAHLSMVRLTLLRRSAELAREPLDASLRRVRALLATQMALDTPAPARPDDPNHAFSSLPEEAPWEDIAPWLERRLELLESEAGSIRAAALTALAAANMRLAAAPKAR